MGPVLGLFHALYSRRSLYNKHTFLQVNWISLPIVEILKSSKRPKKIHILQIITLLNLYGLHTSISINFDIRLDVGFFFIFFYVLRVLHTFGKSSTLYIQAQTSKLLKGMERQGKNFIFFFRILPLFMKTKAHTVFELGNCGSF